MKLTKKDLQGMIQFNTRRSKLGERKLTEREYLNYIYGKGLPSKPVEKKGKYKGIDIPNWAVSTSHIPSVSTDGFSKGLTKDDSWKKDISKNYTVAIAYNKGGYQVLLDSEIKTAGRKI